MITIGTLEIHCVSDGVMWQDRGGVFGLVPKPLWIRRYQPDDQERLPMTLTCLLVRTADKTIVVDTGLGTKLSEKEMGLWGLEHPHGGLLDGLARLGVAPGDVDLVIDTHLHADHCAGNTRYDESGAVVATFPNAEYVVQRREYEDAARPNERTRATYYPANFQPLIDSGQMRLLEGDTEIVPGIRGVVTPGHTPGHQSILFENGGQHALFVSDLASFAIHFERLAWMTAYDVEPLVTLETKRTWQQWALDHDALLIFQHDPIITAGYLRQTDQGRLSIEPADMALA